LFEWQGNQYTTRKADESDLQYQNFLGKKTDNKVLLKEIPEEPADAESFKKVIEGNKMFISNVPAGNEVIKKIVDDLKTEELKENPNRIFIEELPPQVYGIDTTFSEAFQDARKNLGPNATFSWQGKTYSTARADDKKVEEKPQQIIPKKKPIVALYEPKEIESMSFAKKMSVMNETTAGKFALLDLAWANTPPLLRPKNPFTEKSFSSEELNVIKNLVLNSMANKVNNVSVERGDYNVGSENWTYGSADNRIKESRGLTKMVYQHTGSNRATFDILRTLGGFTFSVNNKGETIVTDTYDFNDAEGMFSGSNWKKLFKNATGKDWYGTARAAMSIFGSSEGNGRKFEINLGVLNNDEPKKFRGGGLYQGGRSSRSNSFSSARSAMTSNKAYSGGGQRHNPHTSSGYSKTSNKGGGNVGSGNNNNNNNNNTVKTSSKNTKIKGKEGVILQTNIPTSKDNEKERRNKTLDLLTNRNVKAKAGYFIEGQGNYADAFIEGQSLLSSNPVMTGNINYANKNYGIDVGASYNFNENNFTGSATKTFQPVGMTQEGLIKPYVGVNYNDGDFSPTAGIKISFKKGGLLDKKRGWQNLVRGV